MINSAQKPSHLNRRETRRTVSGDRRIRDARLSCQENSMPTLHQHTLSRRGFCLCCMAAATFTATGGWLSPSQAYAEARNIVDLIRDDAAKAPINTSSGDRALPTVRSRIGTSRRLASGSASVFVGFARAYR